MDIPFVDFYHIWCITDLKGWENRKKDGILAAFNKLKEEGLVKHICVSSHLIKSEIRKLLMEGVFEGVLFGYSVYNFQTRQDAFDAIKAKNLGAVVMNPLGGGVIPQHPEIFGYLCRPGESMTAAALRFLWDHPQISVTLVGFETVVQVREALQAMESYKPRTQEELEELKGKAAGSVEGICTGCGYCDGCPQDIPIPRYMDAYNQKLLAKDGEKDPIGDRLYWHWSLERAGAGKCSACGQCETACTQHLPIIERLKEIAR
jgi:predicted aldo/keto reductase-like oxidoreductase